MSTAYSSAKQQYIGNGVTTEWGFDFPIQKHSELKVYLKRSGQLQVLLEEGVDYSFVTENTIAFPIKTGEAKLQATDVLALQRESVFESEYNFSNQQRLEPEEVMHADDNLERQIQELKRDVTQAIRIQPTSNINTDEYFIAVESIYENLDKINNVSDHSSEIITCSNNIEAIQDAPNQANAASQSASDAAQSATNAVNSATDSANSATASATSANNSHIWAEGTDAQVQALGGVHSSKVWAEQSTNANIALTNSPYTTNRILEIPQNIKLELNNGTLTLKAGSKVYVPNGFEADGTTPHFDIITTTNDLSTTPTVGASTNFIRYQNGELFADWPVNTFSSGADSTGHTGWFYNTTTNTIRYYTNGTPDSANISFPLGISINSGSNVTTSIDQVFNGFGYIGSTVFLLPGVKTVVPNGRNENGTCKNKAPSTVASVKTETISSAYTGYMFTNHASSVIAIHNYICSKTKPTVTATTLWYNPETNLPSQVLSDGTVMTPYLEIPLAKFTSDSTGKITSFEPFTVDSVLNSNLSNLSAAGQNVILNIAAQSGNPTGTIIVWSAPTPPAGYLVCNGAAISRTTYAALFQVIGTTWGAGDGSTTFNLPNLADRDPWYSVALPVGQVGNGHVPNITGVFTGDRIALSFETSGAFYNTTSVRRGNPGGSDASTAAVGFDASRSSQVYSDVDRVIPAYATCLYCIRY